MVFSVIPVSFFVSVECGRQPALVILIYLWIAKGWRRPLEITLRRRGRTIAILGVLLSYIVFHTSETWRFRNPVLRSLLREG